MIPAYICIILQVLSMYYSMFCVCMTKKNFIYENNAMCLNKLFKIVHISLKVFQKNGNVPSVCDGMMAGQGKRHKYFFTPLLKFPCFNAGKIICLVFITVHRKMFEIYPRNRRNRISVFRVRCVRLSENSVITAEFFLIVDITAVEFAKIFRIRCPHQRYGLIILVKCSIQRRQPVKISQNPVLDSTFKLCLPVEVPRHKPEVCRKELQAGISHIPA